ncbi:N-acetylneuraminate synthase family protein [Akkermansiaceae bacterium]|nr:N-acetylneuraminate synthase family protein [Akkermansiaceae bacterium]
MMEDFFRQIKNIASKYDTDDIFILGKGPSIDEVEVSFSQKGIVIAINDAERIAPADISLFHDEWVIGSCREHGFVSDFYMTSHELPAGVPCLQVPHVRPNQESSNLIVQRFNDDEFRLEDVLLISALKIARTVATSRMRRQNVYLLGFDFDMSYGYSRHIKQDFSGDEKMYQANIISIQEHYLLMFLHLLKDSNLHLNHVGEKAYSSMTPRVFSDRFHGGNQSRGSFIGSEKKTGPFGGGARTKRNEQRREHSVLVTAEMTTNHFGETDVLREMVVRSAEAGADLVKVQKRDVDTFYSPEQLDSPYDSPFGHTFGDYRHALELNEEQFGILDKICEECDIRWFLSVLDRPSFDFAVERGVSMIKLPSTISEHRDLFEAVAREYDGEVVISTGLTDQDFEDFVLNTFSQCPRLYLLQCNSAYPTPPEDCNINVIRRYHEYSRRYPNLRPGYSSHDFGSEGCMLAVAAGARMIEKHVKFGDTNWAHFDSVALDLKTDEFAEFVRDIRRAELLCGTEYKLINDSEHHKYWVSNS